MKMQNECWYKARSGWTSDPVQADTLGEVNRVGLHDCYSQKCEERHSGNAEDFSIYLAQSDAGAI